MNNYKPLIENYKELPCCTNPYTFISQDLFFFEEPKNKNIRNSCQPSMKTTQHNILIFSGASHLFPSSSPAVHPGNLLALDCLQV